MRFILPIVAFFAPFFASAHVGYVVTHEQILSSGGMDFPYLLTALKDPKNTLLMFATLLIVVSLYSLAQKEHFVTRYFAQMHTRLVSYYEFVPWILRLSLGIALIGAGTANVLISPLLSGYEIFSFLQIILGFLLLAGFLLVPVALTAFALYLFAFTRDPYILGNLEFASAALAMIILDNARPGFDDILYFPRLAVVELKRYIPLILRIGIGGAMIYLALYEKIFNPHMAELVVKKFHLTQAIPVSTPMWILSAGIIELVIGLFLFFGFQTRLSSAIAFIVLSATFFFFKEEVSSHITLFGILSVLFVTGGGAWSIDTHLAYKHKKMSPQHRPSHIPKETTPAKPKRKYIRKKK